jgi:hypothetical protein
MLNTILSIPTYRPMEELKVLFVFGFIFLAILLIAAIVLFISAVKDARDYDDELDGAIGFFFLAIAAIGLIVGLGFLTAARVKEERLYYEWLPQEIEEELYPQIYSLSLHDNVEGRFTLGSGSINTENYYYFYIDSKYDTYQLTKIKNKGNVYIKESDGTPKVVERKDANSADIYYVIYVPVGTVVTSNFSVS